MDPESHLLVYAEADIREIAKLIHLHPQVIPFRDWRNHRRALFDAEYIFSGWSAPLMDKEFLDAAPKLKAVFYGAGSIRYFVTDEFWNRGIRITSSASANAIPVAEYTLGAILLSLRQFWRKTTEAKIGRGWGDHTRDIAGSYQATIGLLSFGAISRRVARLLKTFDVNIRVYCPFLSDQEAEAVGVIKTDLDELFSLSDVLSIHTPVLPETIGLVNGRLLSRMKPHATLINTSRGVIINQPELVDVFSARPDLHAILDVTDPEPPAHNDALLSLPNINVTSHIAGSHGRDCHRMGRYMLEEFQRYLNNEPLQWELCQKMIMQMA